MEILSLIISLLALAVSGAVGYFYLESVAHQTRKEYRENQPDMQVIGLSAMSDANVLTLFPVIRNVSKVPAYDCTLTLDGWPGEITLGTSYSLGPKCQDHQLSISLGPEVPIRSTPVNPARLRLRYRDYWGGRYEISYPVEQVAQGGTTIYSLTLDLKSPSHTWPNPSYFEIRRLMKNLPSRQW